MSEKDNPQVQYWLGKMRECNIRKIEGIRSYSFNAIASFLVEATNGNIQYAFENKQFYKFDINTGVWKMINEQVFEADVLIPMIEALELYALELYQKASSEQDDSSRHALRELLASVKKIVESNTKKQDLMHEFKIRSICNINDFDQNDFFIGTKEGVISLKYKLDDAYLDNFIGCERENMFFETLDEKAESYLSPKRFKVAKSTNCGYISNRDISEEWEGERPHLKTLEEDNYFFNVIKPKWQKFIDEIMRDADGTVRPEKSQYLQRAIGYSMLGGNPEAVMFVAWGKSTRNGKSALLEIIREVMGDYATTVDPSFLLDNYAANDPDKPSSATVALVGKRFVVMSEPPKRAKLNEAKIKSLTGSDRIRTREIRGISFEFEPKFTFWLACNDLPKVDDQTLFTSERMRIIPFDYHFKPEERKKGLVKEFLDDEWMRIAIFEWIREGFRLYEKYGLEAPEQIKQATDFYQQDNDYLTRFLNTSTQRIDGAKTSRPELFKAFSDFCEGEGIKNPGKGWFFKEMSRSDFELKTIKGTRYYKGLVLIGDSDDE